MSRMEERANQEVLYLHFSHDYGRTSLVATASSDGEGVNISWVILVPKVGTSVPCNISNLVVGTVLSLESGLVVRSDDGVEFVYSPSMSSPS